MLLVRFLLFFAASTYGYAAKERSWPNGIVPFRLHNFNISERLVIQRAMKEIEMNSCVRFVYQGPFDPRYTDLHSLKIYKKNENRCYANGIGKNSWHGNEIHLGPRCIDNRTVLHELMHVLGFNHEHERPDRDRYIKVYWENVKSNYESQFRRDYDIDDLGLEYDYCSVLHYHQYAAAKDPYQFAIQQLESPQISGCKIGEYHRLSELDKVKIQRIYGACKP